MDFLPDRKPKIKHKKGYLWQFISITLHFRQMLLLSPYKVVWGPNGWKATNLIILYGTVASKITVAVTNQMLEVSTS